MEFKETDLNRSLEHEDRRIRMGMKSIGAENLQVQGGRIVRSTGRKDRHSKVYTTKGPRDRRVRLSAHTAIQFYDVQDRLGYDRPSKAVDWLIKKAKSAIDKLSELPLRLPNTEPNGNEFESESSGYNNFQVQNQLAATAENLIPSPLDSAVDFPSYQNLGLSLQTLQNTALNPQTENSPQNHQTAVLYTNGSSNSIPGFDDSYERMVAWNYNVFGSQTILNPSSAAFSQRVPLQSSLASDVTNYAWNDLSIAALGHDQKCHEQSSLTSGRFISSELPEFNAQARFECEDDADVISGKGSSRSSPYSHH